MYEVLGVLGEEVDDDGTEYWVVQYQAEGERAVQWCEPKYGSEAFVYEDSDGEASHYDATREYCEWAGIPLPEINLED